MTSIFGHPGNTTFNRPPEQKSRRKLVLLQKFISKTSVLYQILASGNLSLIRYKSEKKTAVQLFSDQGFCSDNSLIRIKSEFSF